MFDFVISMFNQLGPLGVFLLMLAENIFPPIPSEVILPLAGYHATQQQGSLLVVIAAGTLGSVAGATFWYYVGHWVGIVRLKRLAERHGRWLTLKPADVERVDQWFLTKGHWAVLFGRMVPAVRTLISVPAGVVGMRLPHFLLYTTIGSAIWTSLLTFAGYQLGTQYTQVSNVIEPASNLVLGSAMTWYIWRVITFNRYKN